MEDLKIKKCKFDVVQNEEHLELATDILTIKIYDEFKIDIYNKEGKLITIN